MGHADDLRARGQQTRQQVHPEATGIIDGKHLQRGALALAKQLPGHDIGVVFRLTDEDLVTLVDKGFAEAESDQIQRRRGAGGKDDFLPEFCIQIRPDGIPGRFVLRSGQVRDPVHRPVQVGVVFLRHLGPLANHGQRALRRGGIVQIDKRFAVHLLTEFRELLSYFFYLSHKEMQIYILFL